MIFDITNYINKTNIKRLGWWLIQNPKRTFIIIFMIATFVYRKKNIKKTIPSKWVGEIVAYFRDFKDNGTIELVAKKEVILVNLSNYILPTLPKDIKQNNQAKCEAQVHIYLSHLIKELLTTGDVKINFNKNSEEVEKNKVNGGSPVNISFGGMSDLATELVGRKLLCDLKQIKKLKSDCDWCNIRNKSGLPITN